jgi:hypothetical protein
LYQEIRLQGGGKNDAFLGRTCRGSDISIGDLATVGAINRLQIVRMLRS